MNRFISKTVKYFVFAAAVAAASSCSTVEDRPLLSHIPSDANAVAFVNFKKIAAQSGCDIEPDGKILLSSDVVSFFEHSDVATQTYINLLAVNSPFINNEKIVWYSPVDSDEGVSVFDITDPEGLTKSLGDLAVASTSMGGYTVYAYPECAVLTKGKTGWIARNAQRVIDIESNIGNGYDDVVKPIKEFLEKESHDLEMIFNNTKNTRSGLSYVTCFADFKQGGIYAEFELLDPNYEPYHFSEEISTVDRRLLKYIPSQTQILLAMGKARDWDQVFSALENNVPKQVMEEFGAYYLLAKNYVASVDGTTLFACAPIAGAQAVKQFSLDTWEMLFMSHLPEQEIEGVLAMIQGFLEIQNIESKQISDNEWEFTYQGHKLNYGTVDGYLFVSNYDIMDAGNAEFANSYESKQAVADLIIPYGSETMKALNLKWGIDFNIFLTKKHLRVTVRLPGSKQPVLKELIQAAVETQAVAVVNN